MIYLANNEIIKEPIVLENLPQLETPVLSDIETGATITGFDTVLTVGNLPTGAKLYVNGVEKSGNTFTITPDATAISRSYVYTINLQFKGKSGFEDSDVASYSFTLKNSAPTVNQNSQVTTSASLTVAISRTDTTYVSDLDVKYGVGTDTTTGTSGTSVTITNTSVNSQYNFWVAATNYADKSDVVTKYYHVAGSEKLPTPTISYDETNENFTINIAAFPSDPDLGNYMSSTGYTIYYSLNSETIDMQYNNIAVSCSAGDVIRAKVSSSYGWQDSEVASYSVPVPAPTSIAFNQATYNINQGYSTPANIASFAAFTVTDNLGNDVTNDVTLSSANGMIILANNKHLIPITSGTDTITATYTPSGGTALTTTCTVVSGNRIYLVDYYDQSTEATQPITLPDTDYHSYSVKIVDVNGNDTYGGFKIFGNIGINSAVSSNTSVITTDLWPTQTGFDVIAQSEGNVTITITFTAQNVGTCTYQAQFIYSVPAPTFSDNYTFNDFVQDTQYDDGDTYETTETATTHFAIWDINNDEQVIPDSAPTCSTSDNSVMSVSWDSENHYIEITSMHGAAGEEATASMAITIDGTTYNTTLTISVISGGGEEPSFNDSYTFNDGETDYVSGDVVTIINAGEQEMLFISDNGTCVTPDSTPTCSSDDTSVATITWSSDWGFNNLCGFIINAEATGNTSVSMEMTIDGTTYNTTLEVNIPPYFGNNYYLLVDEADGYNSGDVIELPENSSCTIAICDMDNQDVVTPDSTPTCSSDDTSVATITWDGTHNYFYVSCISEGETTVYMTMTIDDVEYENVNLTITVLAEEPEEESE